MKNYVIVAIIIILIIVGVVWFKMKSSAPVTPGEAVVATEPAPLDAAASVDVAAPAADASGTPVTQ
ncbi:MAG: hypothetical protein NT041_01455 [Candidatus Vogelbacteria bacterium]|nr:hypothetical protein [Candidatus Vogelbacteria bacterium]